MLHPAEIILSVLEAFCMDQSQLAGLISAAFSNAPITSDSVLLTDKYSVAVIRAREVVSLNVSYKEDRAPELYDRLATKLDALLGFLVSQFKVVPSVEEVRKVLSDTTINALNEDNLVDLPDGLVPVSIMRELMKHHRLAVDIRKLSNWALFRSRYEAQVLHA
jgi:hypothetical protein